MNEWYWKLLFCVVFCFCDIYNLHNNQNLIGSSGSSRNNNQTVIINKVVRVENLC